MLCSDAGELERQKYGIPGEHIPTSLPRVPQLAYRKKVSVSVETTLAVGEYVLIPSTETVRDSACRGCDRSPLC